MECDDVCDIPTYTNRHENELEQLFTLEFLRALREMGLEGKWPETQDGL
jgi:hypothetical protein